MKQVVNLASKRKFFDKLDECKKREYAAIEAETLGYGGLSAVHRAFGMSIATIRRGVSELRQGTTIPSNRIRKSGGGRKKNA
jgi:hypothetical protein